MIESCFSLQIEEKLSIDTLEELKKAFEATDSDTSGKLDLQEFKTLLKNRLNLSGAKVSTELQQEMILFVSKNMYMGYTASISCQNLLCTYADA